MKYLSHVVKLVVPRIHSGEELALLFYVVWISVNNINVSYKKQVMQSTESEQWQVSWLYQKCKVILYILVH